jgi:hypothetical protein
MGLILRISAIQVVSTVFNVANQILIVAISALGSGMQLSVRLSGGRPMIIAGLAKVHCL